MRVIGRMVTSLQSLFVASLQSLFTESENQRTAAISLLEAALTELSQELSEKYPNANIDHMSTELFAEVFSMTSPSLEKLLNDTDLMQFLSSNDFFNIVDPFPSGSLFKRMDENLKLSYNLAAQICSNAFFTRVSSLTYDVPGLDGQS